MGAIATVGQAVPGQEQRFGRQDGLVLRRAICVTARSAALSGATSSPVCDSQADSVSGIAIAAS